MEPKDEMENKDMEKPYKKPATTSKKKPAMVDDEEAHTEEETEEPEVEETEEPDKDDEAITGTGFTNEMAEASDHILADTGGRDADRVVIGDGKKMKVSGQKYGNMIMVDHDVYVDGPAPGSETSIVRTLKYAKGTMVSEAEMKKVSE